MTGTALRRELASVLLALTAVFVAGALLFQRPPIDGACLDATGVFGPVGTAVRCTMVTAIGVPGTALVAVGALLVAVQFLGIARQQRQQRQEQQSRGGALAIDASVGAERSDDRRASHLAVLAAGVVLLVPIAIALALGGTRDPEWLPATGLWGGFLGHYLHKYLGAVGGWVVWALALSVLTVLTVRWNPLRALVGSAQRRAAGAQRAVDAATDGARGTSSQTLAERLAPDPSDMPVIDPALARTLGGLAMRPDDDAPLPEEKAPKASRTRTAKDAVDDAATGSGAMARPAHAAVDAIADAMRDPHDGTEFDDELPPTSLLTPAPAGRDDGNKEALDEAGRKLMATLKTFRVDGDLVGRTTGPTVTQFEIEPAAGVKVRQIAALSDDIALAMRAPSIRIVAPIPGRGAVGVEVPNPSPQTVYLREVLESREFQSARAALPVALGIDLEGAPVIADLARMPHLLIAGATGSGKSVCVNTIITSLVYRHTPKTLRFLMVDPKMVELSVYNTLPHLRHKVITDNRDAAAVLKWAVLEMQERYRLLEANGCRNLQEFNKRVTDHEAGSGPAPQTPRNPEVGFEDRTYSGGVLPYLVVVIDEMADLMMTVQAQVETPIAMLAQKARAIGIHLILATQRPSVNVITGLIKANFPCRIAFRVASQVDSRTIIDGAGAEALLGNGDMLFTPPGRSEPSRLQGAFLSSEETDRVMRWYGDLAGRRGAVEAEEPDVLETVRAMEAAADGATDDESPSDGERDSRFREAAEIVLQQRQGSTSLLQRKMKIGYGRAARLIDQLEDAGVLSPSEGPSRPREVLITAADLDRVCGE